MSQQRPAPNPLLTVAMWAVLFLTGYMLLQNGGCGQKAANDTRTMEKVYESIVALNKEGNDIALAQEAAIYERKLAAEKEAGRITEVEVEERKFDVEIIKIETAYVNALRTNNQGKLNTAYTSTFKNLQAKYGKTAFWKRQVPVAPVEGKIEGSSITPEALDELIITDLSAMNKSAKVLGYIPGFHMMEFLVGLTGNNPSLSYWFAALMLAFLVRLAVFPLAQKQYMWGRRMSQLAPYIKEIQEKFKDKKTGKVTDQQAMTMETMDLYKRYGFNPFAGCLPALIQLPLFLIIYQCMLLYRFEFTKGYFLWIHPGAGSFLGMPLAPNLGEKDYLIIILYGISMVCTTLLTPVSDPTNVRQQRMIGISVALIFSVMMFFWPLPSAFVVYWVFTNILATAQSLYVYRMPVAPLEQVQTSAGGAIPTTSRELNGKTSVDPGFFGKTGKGNSKKKKKR